jgi:hypothetical protein
MMPNRGTWTTRRDPAGKISSGSNWKPSVEAVYHHQLRIRGWSTRDTQVGIGAETHHGVGVAALHRVEVAERQRESPVLLEVLNLHAAHHHAHALEKTSG